MLDMDLIWSLFVESLKWAAMFMREVPPSQHGPAFQNSLLGNLETDLKGKIYSGPIIQSASHSYPAHMCTQGRYFTSQGEKQWSTCSNCDYFRGKKRFFCLWHIQYMCTLNTLCSTDVEHFRGNKFTVCQKCSFMFYQSENSILTFLPFEKSSVSVSHVLGAKQALSMWYNWCTTHYSPDWCQSQAVGQWVQCIGLRNNTCMLWPPHIIQVSHNYKTRCLPSQIRKIIIDCHLQTSPLIYLILLYLSTLLVEIRPKAIWFLYKLILTNST